MAGHTTAESRARRHDPAFARPCKPNRPSRPQRSISLICRKARGISRESGPAGVTELRLLRRDAPCGAQSEKRASTRDQRSRGGLSGAADTARQPALHGDELALPTRVELRSLASAGTMKTGLKSCIKGSSSTQCLHNTGGTHLLTQSSLLATAKRRTQPGPAETQHQQPPR